MKTEFRYRTFVALFAIVALAGCGPAADVQPASTDTRQRLVFAAADRDKVLQEMRLMLESIDQIMQGLADSDLPRVEKHARASGMAIAVDIDPKIMQQLPQQFRDLGMRTHKGFDALADRVRDGGSLDGVIKDLAGLTGNCVGCHVAYRLDEAR